MESIASRMFKWQEEHRRPLRVGMVGAGDFGSGIVYQTAKMEGIEVSVLSDLTVKKAVEAYTNAGYSEADIVCADSPAEIRKGIEANKKVVVEDGMLIPESPVDVTVDSTGYPDFGAYFAYCSIQNGKHVLMVNLEADIVVGPILRTLADKAGVVYTESDGDQPSLIKGLVDWAQALGFEVVTAGKGSHVYPNYNEEERGRFYDHIDRSFMDGTKSQEEMGCVANMTGFVPDILGMHKLSMTLDKVPGVYCPREHGGILSRKGVVEVVNCITEDSTDTDEKVIEPYLQGGVFIVVTSDNPKIMEYLRRKNGFMDKTGRYSLIFRPHHLVGVEAPMSILKAVLYHEATGCVRAKPVVDVVAVAKRNIRKGETLNGIGGEAVKGLIVEWPIASHNGYLPYGLADAVSVMQDIPKGTILTYTMLERPGQSFLWHLRGLQNILNSPTPVRYKKAWDATSSYL
jgi:predicted homoserine dehydrogenase-like protein